MSNHGTLWTEMAPRAFDTAAPDTQLGLFAADSQGYTGADLFSDEEAAPAAAELAECPQCGSRELPAYLERHVARHNRLARDHAERLELDNRARAAFGPVR